MEPTLTSLCPAVRPLLPLPTAVLLPVRLSALTGLPLPVWAELPATLCCDVTVASLLAECLVTVSSDDISA